MNMKVALLALLVFLVVTAMITTVLTTPDKESKVSGSRKVLEDGSNRFTLCNYTYASPNGKDKGGGWP